MSPSSVSSVLLAEDDDLLRKTSACLLESRCHVIVRMAASREEALRIIAGANAEAMPVAITDLRMPNRGDGEEVAKAAFAKEMEVIILSGSLQDLSDEVRERCRAVFDKCKGVSVIFETLKECLANR